ncbi:MAG: prephenate dehydratase [Paracoccaceae bacterium]|jgi:prephenate dehydratase|nr:prephenate dehydratase [Paracoccaceae bacterium]
MTKKISFQGELGAYSHQACIQAKPNYESIPCSTFEAAMEQVRLEEADLAMLPIENSTYGRVSDIHRLLPDSQLHIVGEVFVRVRISLLGVKGAKLSEIKSAVSHSVLLGQCRNFLTNQRIEPIAGADTAGSARYISELDDSSKAALASELAGKIYGLSVLAKDIEDNDNNTTRFLIMSKTPGDQKKIEQGMMTSFVFRVKNIPAALFKAMGGFATNGVNMTKLESYMVDGDFTATQFYADIEGHPDDKNVSLAFEELSFFTSEIKILGSYKADSKRT